MQRTPWRGFCLTPARLSPDGGRRTESTHECQQDHGGQTSFINIRMLLTIFSRYALRDGWWVDEEAKLTVSEALGRAVGRQPAS